LATVINLWAGPGSGKSTLAAGLFYRLKAMHLEVELTSEFAKDLVYAKRHNDMNDQVYIFGKQQYRVQRLARDCDYIITDSPVLMGLVYAPDYPKCFRDTVAWAYDRNENINILVKRASAYNPNGRNQTEAEAIEKDAEIVALMHEFGLCYDVVTGNDEGLEAAVNIVRDRIG
jgi:adenylate kinase family enzyme